ncbi:MAG: SPASM domain-containing protein [Opitutae bacterium]|nr:SPASM domain-containing protein [Opitutae bacterium]
MNALPSVDEPVVPPTAKEKRTLLMAQARAALAKVFEVPNLTYVQRLAHAKTINQSLAKLEYQDGAAQLSCRPLTNKDFFAMLELFSGYGLATGFYTNATLLAPDKVDRIIRMGIQQVNISIDGATAATFEAIRHHANFDVVVRNARHLVARRRELGAPTPRLQIAMVLMRENLHELPDLVRLAADLGADSVYTMFVSDLVPDQMCEREPTRANATLREARRVAAELKIRLQCPDYLPEHATAEAAAARETVVPAMPASGCLCSHPWQQFVVWNDGNVSPCCRIRDDVDGEKFGSIHDAEPEQLWNSPGFVRLRERLAARNPPHACQVCPIRTVAMH